MAALGRLPAVLGMRRMQKLKIRIFQVGEILEGKPEGYARQGAHFRFLFVTKYPARRASDASCRISADAGAGRGTCGICRIIYYFFAGEK